MKSVYRCGRLAVFAGLSSAVLSWRADLGLPEVMSGIEMAAHAALGMIIINGMQRVERAFCAWHIDPLPDVKPVDLRAGSPTTSTAVRA